MIYSILLAMPQVVNASAVHEGLGGQGQISCCGHGWIASDMEFLLGGNETMKVAAYKIT
ncbi:MAG: hypothetical protein UX83_C0011G0051 [Candidatus Wolfebacteria bacterium GW2011_GWE2_47_12]|nr:MAG: hypothetical protein UX83_C0011G0051 [Candidatus Wolfebacteria bacterium GW2011_GWE2_47_12]KKU65420.1 MAG: hypothetical protein UX90_C0006G0024 [Candidatus Wolfebacteria bacterium GW2011_GWD2_47_17]